MTLKDIARCAGVSRGTVDRVIHHRPHVSNQALCKVRRVLEHAEWTPNLAAKALGSQNVYFFAVIFAHNSGAFTADVLRGARDAEKTIKAFGFSVQVETIIAYTAEKQLELLEFYEKQGVAGIAIVPILDARIIAKINELDAQGVPVITFNSDIENTRRLCFIGADNYKEGRTAAGLLEGLVSANSDVLVIAGSHALYCHEKRIKGFFERLGESKKNLRLRAVIENHDSDTESSAILHEYCKKPGPPAGIYLTGGGAQGLGEAVKHLCGEKPHIVCHDVTPETVRLLCENVIDFTIGQNPHDQGFLPLQLLFNLAVKDEHIQKEIFYTSIDIYTKENCGDIPQISMPEVDAL
ncbi:MAG: LacI family DNA-binding transcriptional regulator [Spirochaetaceae bacterium]|jgi:LacI family transcriptional regulator|nr:LacI family DNA-binding transcriptional regulator [Spirochaetaceae bacterium]